MLIDLLIENLWLSLGLWIIIYISDYYLTIYAARIYQAGANKHIVLEKGFELTPYFRKDIDSLKRISPRFILALLYSCFILVFFWLATAKSTPVVFEFIIGAMILLEISVHMRHIRNIIIFRYAKYSKGIRGTIEYTRWVSLRASAVELLEFAILFLFIFFLSNRVFFIGGTATCLITAIKHWKWSYKDSPKFQDPVMNNPIK
jgi:hypothetical protein